MGEERKDTEETALQEEFWGQRWLGCYSEGKHWLLEQSSDSCICFSHGSLQCRMATLSLKTLMEELSCPVLVTSASPRFVTSFNFFLLTQSPPGYVQTSLFWVKSHVGAGLCSSPYLNLTVSVKPYFQMKRHPWMLESRLPISFSLFQSCVSFHLIETMRILLFPKPHIIPKGWKTSSHISDLADLYNRGTSLLSPR